MKIENQASRLYRGGGGRQSLSFLERANSQSKHAGTIALIAERSGNDTFAQLIEPDYVRNVRSLQFFSLRSFLWSPFGTAPEKSKVGSGHLGWRRRFLHHVFRPPRMHFHYQMTGRHCGVGVG